MDLAAVSCLGHIKCVSFDWLSEWVRQWMCCNYVGLEHFQLLYSRVAPGHASSPRSKSLYTWNTGLFTGRFKETCKRWVCLLSVLVSVWHNGGQRDNGRARADYKPRGHETEAWSHGRRHKSRRTTNHGWRSGQSAVSLLRSVYVCVFVSVCVSMSLFVSLLFCLAVDFTHSVCF